MKIEYELMMFGVNQHTHTHTPICAYLHKQTQITQSFLRSKVRSIVVAYPFYNNIILPWYTGIYIW